MVSKMLTICSTGRRSAYFCTFDLASARDKFELSSSLCSFQLSADQCGQDHQCG